MRFEWSGNFFNDETDATQTMRGHFFYTISFSLITIFFHVAVVSAIKLILKTDVPGALKIPQVGGL